MSNDRARQPKGTPSGGQFSAQVRPAGQVSLEDEDQREVSAAHLQARLAELLPGLRVHYATSRARGCGIPADSLHLEISASTGQIAGREGEVVAEYNISGFLAPEGGMVEGVVSHSWPVTNEHYTHASTYVQLGRVVDNAIADLPGTLERLRTQAARQQLVDQEIPYDQTRIIATVGHGRLRLEAYESMGTVVVGIDDDHLEVHASGLTSVQVHPDDRGRLLGSLGHHLLCKAARFSEITGPDSGLEYMRGLLDRLAQRRAR